MEVNPRRGPSRSIVDPLVADSGITSASHPIMLLSLVAHPIMPLSCGSARHGITRRHVVGGNYPQIILPHSAVMIPPACYRRNGLIDQGTTLKQHPGAFDVADPVPLANRCDGKSREPRLGVSTQIAPLCVEMISRETVL